MATSVCTAEDIVYLNETKEYTLTATSLLEKLIRDTSLTGQASKLWLVLYNKARFQNNLSVDISYRELSQILGKSTKTIGRYVKSLVENNYLISTPLFHQSGGQNHNLYAIRFPYDSVEEIKHNKDRAKTPTKNDENFSDPEDKIAPPLPDTSVQPNNTNNIYTNKTTDNLGKTKIVENVVVDKKEFKEEEKSQKKEKLKNSLKCANEVLSQLYNEKVEPSDKFQKIREQSALISELERRILNFENQDKKNITENREENFKQENETRVFSEAQVKKLKYLLKQYCTEDKSLDRLMNETSFAIRFGSLTRNSQTQKELTIDHAIHIAVKLVREKRWTTPIEMLQTTQNKNYNSSVRKSNVYSIGEYI